MGTICKKKIGLGNYKFGNKNNWRRWMWNKVKNQLKNPCPLMRKLKLISDHRRTIGDDDCYMPSHKAIKDSIVLYLPAIDDIDRIIAVDKGFRPLNMIAVDIDDKVIKQFRKDHKLILKADIVDIILNWNGVPKLDIIVADLCCGITLKMHKLAHALIYSKGISEMSVIAINLMRGRDEFVKNYRGDGEKHRGKIFIKIIKKILTYCAGLGGGLTEMVLTEMIIDETCVFNSYKSINGTVMDSVVFVLKRIENIKEQKYFDVDKIKADKLRQLIYEYVDSRDKVNYEIIKKVYNKLEGLRLGGIDYNIKNLTIKRQVAAIKAHRTMRLKNK